MNWLKWKLLEWKGMPMLFNLLTTLRESAAGKKTYVVGLMMIAYGVSGFLLGETKQAEATRMVLEAFAIIFLRAGVAKL